MQEQTSYLEITKKYESEFMADLALLKCQRPSIVLRVTQHVNEIVKFIAKLIENKQAYRTESGSVYFDSSKVNVVNRFIQSIDSNDNDNSLDDDPLNKGNIII